MSSDPAIASRVKANRIATYIRVTVEEFRTRGLTVVDLSVHLAEIMRVVRVLNVPGDEKRDIVLGVVRRLVELSGDMSDAAKASTLAVLDVGGVVLVDAIFLAAPAAFRRAVGWFSMCACVDVEKRSLRRLRSRQ